MQLIHYQIHIATAMSAFFISNNGTIQYDGLSTLNYNKIFTQSISVMLKPVNFGVSYSCSVALSIGQINWIQY